MSSYQIRMLQARCAALGFWPGPIDGKYGPRTRAAEAEARAAQKRRGRPLIHPSGISIIRWHWTGGAHTANATDRRAYHRLYQGDGSVIAAHPLTAHLAHTRHANDGAIGQSLCAMRGAVERPFDAGRSPITEVQLDAMLIDSARFALEYDIPVSIWSTHSHAEVQPTLGIAQRQKWDICWLPGMSRPGDPIEVGNMLRDMLRRKLMAMA